jgi:ABC-type Fe3+-citrate transport system substrate-binding protein
MNRLIVMVLVVTILMLGCAPSAQNDSEYNERVVRQDAGLVDVYHDNLLSVTCWVLYDAISCLPDWFIRGESPER